MILFSRNVNIWKSDAENAAYLKQSRLYYPNWYLPAVRKEFDLNMKLFAFYDKTLGLSNETIGKLVGFFIKMITKFTLQKGWTDIPSK